MKYELRAQNESGATVCFRGQSIRSVIDQFDSEYERKGFKIFVYQEGLVIKIIKATYK